MNIAINIKSGQIQHLSMIKIQQFRREGNIFQVKKGIYEQHTPNI